MTIMATTCQTMEIAMAIRQSPSHAKIHLMDTILEESNVLSRIHYVETIMAALILKNETVIKKT
jgi:hypothetical protein